jgi:hypothetical protein
MDGSWNPWKMTAIGVALIVMTALVTTVIVAKWKPPAADPSAVVAASPSSALPATPAPPPAPAAQAEPAPHPSLPAAVEACNKYAAGRPSHRDKTVEVVKDGAIGGAIGAAVGAAGGAIAGGGSGAGKGAGIGGLVGIGGGVLYGLNENKKSDERYRRAYAGCMRSHGYGG